MHSFCFKVDKNVYVKFDYFRKIANLGRFYENRNNNFVKEKHLCKNDVFCAHNFEKITVLYTDLSERIVTPRMFLELHSFPERHVWH